MIELIPRIENEEAKAGCKNLIHNILIDAFMGSMKEACDKIVEGVPPDEEDELRITCVKAAQGVENNLARFKFIHHA